MRGLQVAGVGAVLVLGALLPSGPAGAQTRSASRAPAAHHHVVGLVPGAEPSARSACDAAQQDRLLLANWLYSITGAAKYRTANANPTCLAASLALRAATTPDPSPPSPPAPAPSPAPPPSPPSTAAPVSVPPSTPAPATSASGYGCAAALAYLSTHAAPGYQLVCPGYALGHEAMTCNNWPTVCPGQKEIVISDPCPVAYMNEASNSLVFSDLSTAPIDAYGYSCAS